MANRPEFGAVSGRMEARNHVRGYRADLASRIKAAMHHESMAVAERVARSELDEVLTAGLRSRPAAGRSGRDLHRPLHVRGTLSRRIHLLIRRSDLLCHAGRTIKLNQKRERGQARQKC